MPSAYSELGITAAGKRETSTEFTQEKANLLHNLAYNYCGTTIQLAISWREGEETANIAFKIKDVKGKPYTIRLHGEYFKLKERLLHHFAQVHDYFNEKRKEALDD